MDGFAKKTGNVARLISSGGERMSKIRVYEYAKKHNISSKEVITKLKEMNIEVSNHMATIEDDSS